MTIIEAEKFGADKLKKVDITSAILETEVLLSAILNQSKELILANPNLKITKAQEKKYKSLIKRREKFEPVAYLIGKKEFYGLTFKVNKNVLIPRPETELLVDEVINFVTETKKQKNKKTKINIIDIGTGSGAIAIALKTHLPQAKIIATDNSKAALKVAQINAELNKTEIQFIYSDLISKIKDKIDIIAANLPYLPSEEKDSKNIFSLALKYEPKPALFAGQYGLGEYEKLFKQIKNLKIKPQVIVCEIGPTYINKTKKLVKENFPNWRLKIKKDLCGKNRLLIIKKPG